MNHNNLLLYRQQKISLEKKRFHVYKQIADLRREGEDNFSQILGELLNRKELLDHQIENLEQEIAESRIDFNLPVAEYILNMDDEIRVIKIVEPHAANPNIGLISYNSPLANALITSNSEVINVKTPTGLKTYKVLSRISND